MRVVVLEDSEDVALYLRYDLQTSTDDTDVIVLEPSDVPDFDWSTVDVVITDWMMPTAAVGQAVVDHIAEVQPHLPIVILTADSTLLRYRFPNVAVVQKPSTAEAILRVAEALREVA